MDRAKASARGKKIPGRTHAPTGDLIALGAAKASVSDPDAKRSASPQPGMMRKMPMGDRKREGGAASLLLAGAAKKPKPSTSVPPLARGFGEAERRGSPANVTVIPVLDESGASAEVTELFSLIESAQENGDTDQLDALLLGTVRTLRNTRAKPEPLLCLTLMHLAKATATNSIFRSHTVVTGFCSLLQRDPSINFKSKGNPIVSVLACNIMMTAFADELTWPLEFVKVYVDDAMGERIWVDHPECKVFVQNILTAFGTVPLPGLQTQASEAGLGDVGGAGRLGGLGLLPSGSCSPHSSRPGSPMATDEDDTKDSGTSDKDKTAVSEPELDAPPRYGEKMAEVERYVTEVIREHYNLFKDRRPQVDLSWRNFIMLMTSACGYAEVRAMGAQRVEQWLQNPKLSQKAQELMMSICVNCTPNDQEVITSLCKLRFLKHKQNVSLYHSCLRELMAQHDANLKIVLTHTVYNELSSSRNPTNVSLFATTFQSFPEKAAAMLGDIFHDFLTNKEDYLRALRVMYRETIARGMRVSLRFKEFCFSLLTEKTDTKLMSLEPVFRERYVSAVADLVVFAMMVGASPQVREAHSSLLRGEPKNVKALQEFREAVGEVQARCVLWVQQVAPRYLDKMKQEFHIHLLQKMLFLEPQESYTGKENWPLEPDRSLIIQILNEVPLREDVLEMVLVMGLKSKQPIQKDIANCAEMLVRRAAVLGEEGLLIEKPRCIDLLMNLASYRVPDDKSFPEGYTPASYAVIGIYWRSCIMLVILAALKPSVIGKLCWKNNPTVRCLMEMVMTNNFSFPPLTISADQAELDAFMWRDQQIQNEEREKILEFEGYLAATTITSNNSLLLPNLILMDPEGQARRPPPDTVKELVIFNANLRLGIMLCRSRDPDFLMELINRQGAQRSMPWLAELVDQSEGSLDVLPVQCLCEFLLHESPELLPPNPDGSQDEGLALQEQQKQQQLKQRKQQQLLTRLQRLVRDAEGNVEPMSMVLQYFLQRLNHRHTATRAQAIKGLALVLTEMEEKTKMEVDEDPDWKPYDWLLVLLPSLPLFDHVREQICKHIGNALQEEMDPKLVSAYLLFLSRHAPGLPNLPDLINDVTRLLSDRPNVIKYMVPLKDRTAMQDQTLAAFISLYYQHLQAAITDTSNIPWCSDQDVILIHWAQNRSAILPNMVVHAVITLLSYGPPAGESLYEQLLDLWVLPNGEMPRATLMDTQEEALLLPDILRLKMIRSSHPRLVQAALQELDVQQVLLYVQFFGIPVANMSQLLAYLDSAVSLDPQALEQALVDKAYVAQLVRVQKMRGATGGERFLQAFGSAPPPGQTRREETMEEGGSSQQPKPAADQRSSPLAVDSIPKVLLKVFDPQSLRDKETIELYQNVLQTICNSEQISMIILLSFKMLLGSQDGQKIVDTFSQIPTRACPMIKLFIAKRPRLHKTLAEVLSVVLSKTADCKSLVATLMRQFLEDYEQNKQRKKGETGGQEVTELVQRLQGQGKLEGDLVVKGLQDLSIKSRADLETLVEGYMEDTMRRGQTAEGARVACRVLLDSESGCSMSESAAALFLDWLELLDPEVVSSNAELQQQLLFAQKLVGGRGGEGTSSSSSSSGGGGAAKPRSKLPHLLALLTHQSHWSTLHRCLDKLLYRPSTATYDATAVLDFLWACQHIPKLWRGRDHRATTKADPEDVFMFSVDQILSIVDFILQEAETEDAKDGVNGDANPGPQGDGPQGDGPQGDGSRAGSEDCPGSVRARMGLLVTCLCEDATRLRAVVEYLCKGQEAGVGVGGVGGALRRQQEKEQQQEQLRLALLQELYLHFPYVLAWLPESLDPASLQSSQLSSSKMDVITHRLLTTLGNAVPGKTASQRMLDANYALRKLASRHPLLILRQLPMVGALLQGKTDFTFVEMKHRNYLHLFTHVLGLMQLLQPHIFRPDVHGLPEVLEAFFSLLKAHGGSQKSLAILIVKLVVFLQQYVQLDPQSAIPILQGKVELLGAISAGFPDLSELKSLLAGLTLPRQTRGPDPLAREEGGGPGGPSTTPAPAAAKTPAPAPPMKTPSQWTVAQLAPFARKMTKDCPPEMILDVLTDLDETSKRKLEILKYFESELMRLMSHSNEKCREKAFALVLRHMEFAPRCASVFVPVFLRCVESEDPGVRRSAMNNLTEFTLLCQDHAQVILRTAFAVNISTSADKDSVIGDTLQLLNLEQPKAQS